MSVYPSIAPYYESLFPLKEIRKNFIERHIKIKKSRLLDVGCGTGELVRYLSKRSKTVTGIDPSDDMIRSARLNTRGLYNVIFEKKGMLDLDDLFDNETLDGILCLGNTLPHLKDRSEVERFLRSCRSKLISGGHLIVQTVNFDRIFKQHLKHLPTLTKAGFTFERRYSYTGANPDAVDFQTRLLKNDSLYSEGTERLLSIRQSELSKQIKDTGFGIVSFFSDENDAPYSEAGAATIFVAKK